MLFPPKDWETAKVAINGRFEPLGKYPEIERIAAIASRALAYSINPTTENTWYKKERKNKEDKSKNS